MSFESKFLFLILFFFIEHYHSSQELHFLHTAKSALPATNFTQILKNRLFYLSVSLLFKFFTDLGQSWLLTDWEELSKENHQKHGLLRGHINQVWKTLQYCQAAIG